jgi:hypothetical protein
MLLYRDVKFLHTPGTIGLLALCFRIFGPQTAVVKAFALAGPLVAHVGVLASTRPLSVPRRLLISSFFLVSFLVSNGNAVWPTVLMAALALPMARSLTQERWIRAGLLIGSAILLKQTAAFLLIVIAPLLVLRRQWRGLARVVIAASLPYFAALAGFWLAGAGGDMLRWTLLVPFQVQEVTFSPSLFTVAMLAAAFLPTAVACFLEEKGRSPSAVWLLAVALGLTLLSYPNFLLLQTVAALPALAVGAARLLEIGGRSLSALAAVFLLVLTLSRGVVLVAGEEFDGRVLFWNEDPDLNAVIERLRRLPPGARVQSELWANVLPRSRRMPPGTVWVHPWLRWYLGVDRSRERVLEAARTPGTFWVNYRGALPAGEPIGPYAIWRVGASIPRARDQKE